MPSGRIPRPLVAPWPACAVRRVGGRTRRYAVPAQKAFPGLRPNFLRMMARGQNPVKADWKRLKPTKAVSQSQLELTE